ncbi:MAG: type II 3-dehydroquinate dehydratase [Candidatus Marinimicrobia bacterium]|nr:type II 3-dehydroquinate dehydratase [Candidatus Neomarinimicrobiota bacterium]
MTQKPMQKNILVIHGPNMNLLGHRKIEANPNITLDKLNKNLRKVANGLELKLKIIQTNDESRAVNIVQRQRNKICGLLLFPGPWQKSAYALQDTLELLSIPFVTISLGDKVEVLQGLKNFEEVDIYKAGELALIHLSGSI